MKLRHIALRKIQAHMHAMDLGFAIQCSEDVYYYRRHVL